MNESSQLLHPGKAALRKKCEQHGIQPRRNKTGEHGFVKYGIRRRHNNSGSCF